MVSIISKTNKRQYFLIFLCLGILVFFSYGQSLKLSLYGDDWLTISKYFVNYGPHGRVGGYFDKSVIFSNYGPQFLTMGFAYALFNNNPAPYFYTSLFFRTLVAFGVYWFSKKLIGERTGIIASLLFAVSSTGAETTDWVYNFSSYLGIAAALFGLIFYILRLNTRKLIMGLFIIILSYVTVIIRLFIMPMLIFFLELILEILSKKINSLKLLKIIFFSLLVFLPFILIKIIFPGIGFQQVNQQQIGEGYIKAITMLSQGRWDFLLTPFTNLGLMIFPLGFQQLADSGLLIYPLKNFLISGLFLLLLATPILMISFKNLDGKKIKMIFVFNLGILLFLRFILNIKEDSILRGFAHFSWTFIGIIFCIFSIFLITRSFFEKNRLQTSFYFVGFVFTLSFLFPWAYDPGYIADPTGRYLILPSVGLAIILGGLLTFNFSKTKKYSFLQSNLQLLLIAAFIIIHIINSNIYFSQKLVSRGSNLNEMLFSQIKVIVPELPDDQASLFYFENNQPLVFENLLRFGFGYHMQVLYNTKLSEQEYPFSVGSKEDLIATMTDRRFTKRLGYKSIPPIDHVFAFRLLEDRLEDITQQTRNYLYESIKKNPVEK